MQAFSKIGVTIKPVDEELTRSLTGNLLTYLDERGIHHQLDESLKTIGFSAEKTVSREDLVKDSDLIIVIGGDGTLLDAARSIAGTNIALIGVNIGRLGFLVDVSPAEFATQLDEIFAGNYHEEKRAMLHAKVMRDGEMIAAGNAFNDIAMHNRTRIRMIEFETRIDDQRVNTHRADGIVVCTPTGSTAYALSGGGPILHPELDALALVPICPHTLSKRPIVVTGNSKITLRLLQNSHTDAMVAFDAQNTVDIEANDEIKICRHEKPLRLLHPPGYDYYSILRKKLRWSEQP
jgi:NAD+ kinase